MALIYKIVAKNAWQETVAADIFTGSAVDVADGFIHLSDSSQVEETARRHFSGQTQLLLVAFEADDFGPELKWEASRGGALFPHVYGRLVPSRARWVRDLAWTGTDFDFPAGWRG
jgi:uncharacterized protein (DUF952 family)